MRDICGILGVNRSSFYYQPKADLSEVSVLRAEIEKLAGRYLRYGYRRITQLLQRQGYTVSMTIKASPRQEIASDILSHRCIIRNAHIRR